MNGRALISWMKDLFPMNRSLSGDGNRETLNYLKQLVPELQINEFFSGERVFDWTVPDEWNVTDAYIETADGRKVAHFKVNNLHLVGYSEPVNRVMDKFELLSHIHYLPEYPNVIPYVTSYYQKNWGFCVTKHEYDSLGDGPFKVFIGSSYKSRELGGSLSYGEIVFPGISSQEVLFSTYICHPSMANNELSGPVISIALAKYLSSNSHHYTYRFLFLPETIGSIAYLHRNLPALKKSVIAGWVLTCLGDAGEFSYIPSRMGNNYADKITKETLDRFAPSYQKYSWLDRGSDERQYCSPGIDLPFSSITRSKYGTYKEYHTSADNLNLISEASIFDSYILFVNLITRIEELRVPKMKVLCEPQFGKRGLYPNLSRRDAYTENVRSLKDVCSYFDGAHTIEEVADVCGVTTTRVKEVIELLLSENLIDI
jgi:aminopeptidase-like protein